MNKKKILITGGAGYIGSHCVIELHENGFIPVIVDNFSNSHKKVIKNIEKIVKKKTIYYQLDIKNTKKLDLIFKKHKFLGVIHCAGHKSVNESRKQPILYLNNNISSTLSLLECMKKNKVFKMIFSSSATVYNSKERLPFSEKSRTGQTENSYATSKHLIERILKDVSDSNSLWSFAIARYFNPISNHHSGLIKENPKGIPNNLVPYIVGVVKKKFSHLKIYGKNYQTYDGTCLRDYIHVVDLAKGHIAILKNKRFKSGIDIFNFGTGKASSVLEVVKAFEKILGFSLPKKIVKRREGDIPISYCNPNKSHKYLNWKANYSLEKSIEDIIQSI